jgi:hypothetical protein
LLAFRSVFDVLDPYGVTLLIHWRESVQLTLQMVALGVPIMVATRSMLSLWLARELKVIQNVWTELRAMYRVLGLEVGASD